MTFSWRYFCHHFKNLEVLFLYDIISLFTFLFWLGFSSSNDVTIPHAIFIRRDFSRVARNQMTYVKTEHLLSQTTLFLLRVAAAYCTENVKSESNFIFTIFFIYTSHEIRWTEYMIWGDDKDGNEENQKEGGIVLSCLRTSSVSIPRFEVWQCGTHL